MTAFTTGPVASGIMRLSGFMLPLPFTARSVGLPSSNNTPPAGATLARLALYALQPDGSLTLLTATVNDPTIASVASVYYVRPLTAPVDLAANTTYYFGALLYGNTNNVPYMGVNVGAVGSMQAAVAPRQALHVAGLTDLPATITAAAALTTNHSIFGTLLSTATYGDTVSDGAPDDGGDGS